MRIDLRSILTHLVQVTKDIGQTVVLFGIRRGRQTRADAFLFLQCPFCDDCVDQFVGFRSERLSHQVAVTANVNDRQFGQRLAASQIFRHRCALSNISFKCLNKSNICTLLYL